MKRDPTGGPDRLVEVLDVLPAPGKVKKQSPKAPKFDINAILEPIPTKPTGRPKVVLQPAKNAVFKTPTGKPVETLVTPGDQTLKQFPRRTKPKLVTGKLELPANKGKWKYQIPKPDFQTFTGQIKEAKDSTATGSARSAYVLGSFDGKLKVEGDEAKRKKFLLGVGVEAGEVNSFVVVRLPRQPRSRLFTN